MTGLPEFKPVELTFDEALDLLKRAVSEKGEDYVHKGKCVYFSEYDVPGETAPPRCIVGHVLAYKGLTRADLEFTNDAGLPDTLNSMNGVYELAEFGVIKCDSDTVTLLAAAQGAQDAHKTWGMSLQQALDEINEERDE